eukprot:gene11679-12889_t
MAERSGDYVSSHIAKFEGKNFHLWKFKMQMILEDKDLWNIVCGEEEEPVGEGSTEASIQRFRKRARKAFATICLSLGDNQLSLVRSAQTAREAWLKLEGHYEVKSLANKLFLRKQYFSATMSEGDTMMEHVNKMRSLAEQLSSVGAQVSEDDQVATLLCSLPDSYNNLIVALESRADDLNMEFVIARLLHEERKRCEVSSDPDIAMEKALMAAKEKPSMHKPKFGNKRGKCFNCGLKGHFARNCHKPKKSKEKHEQQANFTETTDNKNALFGGSSNTNSDECFIWYIDSGASQHMSCNKNWMKNYNEFSVPEKVRLGDNRTVEALGKGTVWLRVMADGKYKPVEMSDVLYVPSLVKNLFSVRAVVDKDLTVIFKDDQCIISNKSGNVMGSGKKDGKLFILDCNMMDNQSHQVHSAIGEKKKTNDQHAETPVISQPDVCIDNSEQETEDEETVADMQIDPGANGEDNQNAEN